MLIRIFQIRNFVIILLLFLSLFLNACLKADVTEDECINASASSVVGELIIGREIQRSFINGSDPFGAGPVFETFKEEYTAIEPCLSDVQKLNIFWAMLWHMDFDGGLMEDFLAMTHHETGDLFSERLTHYIEKEREIKRDSGRLRLAEKVRYTLVELSSTQNDER